MLRTARKPKICPVVYTVTPGSLGASGTSSVVDEEEKVLFHLPAISYAPLELFHAPN